MRYEMDVNIRVLKDEDYDVIRTRTTSVEGDAVDVARMLLFLLAEFREVAGLIGSPVAKQENTISIKPLHLPEKYPDVSITPYGEGFPT
jgi:hypothetical protein